MTDTKETKCQKLVRLMQDGRWYSMRELLAVGGFRYGGRLFEMKALGWEHEIEVRANDERFYRIYRKPPVGMQMRLRLTSEKHTTHMEALR